MSSPVLPHSLRYRVLTTAPNQLVAGKSFYVHQSFLQGCNAAYITEWNYNIFFSPETNSFHKFLWLHFLFGPGRPQRRYYHVCHQEAEDTVQALVVSEQENWGWLISSTCNNSVDISRRQVLLRAAGREQKTKSPGQEGSGKSQHGQS